MKETTFGVGIAIDVTWHNGLPHVVYHNDALDMVLVERCSLDLQIHHNLDSIAVGPSGNAAPRIYSDGKDLRTVYRVSKDGKDRGYLRQLNALESNLGVVYSSVRPFVFGHGQLVVQRSDTHADVIRLSDGFTRQATFPQAPTGLSDIDAEGRVWTWDERRTLHHWGLGWTLDGLAEFADGLKSGIVGQLRGSPGYFALWADQQVDGPRVAVNSPHILVGAWAKGGKPVCVALLTENDLVSTLPGPVLPPPPPPQTVTVTPINRALHFGYYFDFGDRYGDNTSAPGNVSVCLDVGGIKRALARGRRVIVGTHAQVRDANYLTAELDAAKADWGQVVAVNVVDEGSLALLTAKVTHAVNAMALRGLARRPIFVYTARKGWSGGAEWVGVECYPDPHETDAQFDQRMDDAFDATPADKTLVLVCMAYDRNGAFVDRARLVRLQGRWSALAARIGRVNTILLFSDGRPGGTRDHEELRPVHRQTFATVKGLLPIVTIGATVPGAPLALTIAWYGPRFGLAPLSVRAVAQLTGGVFKTLTWRYRMLSSTVWIQSAVNPASDLDHTFRFAQPGVYQISLLGTDAAGRTAETGKDRRITVT